jgi:hypothetical protein
MANTVNNYFYGPSTHITNNTSSEVSWETARADELWKTKKFLQYDFRGYFTLQSEMLIIYGIETRENSMGAKWLQQQSEIENTPGSVNEAIKKIKALMKEEKFPINYEDYKVRPCEQINCNKKARCWFAHSALAHAAFLKFRRMYQREVEQIKTAYLQNPKSISTSQISAHLDQVVYSPHPGFARPLIGTTNQFHSLPVPLQIPYGYQPTLVQSGYTNYSYPQFYQGPLSPQYVPSPLSMNPQYSPDPPYDTHVPSIAQMHSNPPPFYPLEERPEGVREEQRSSNNICPEDDFLNKATTAYQEEDDFLNEATIAYQEG